MFTDFTNSSIYTSPSITGVVGHAVYSGGGGFEGFRGEKRFKSTYTSESLSLYSKPVLAILLAQVWGEKGIKEAAENWIR